VRREGEIMSDDIEQLLNKDNINSALQEVSEDMKDWDNFGSIVIVYTFDDRTKYRMFGSNAEIIGLLELAKQTFIDRVLYDKEEDK
jgi:hypothetical protein